MSYEQQPKRRGRPAGSRLPASEQTRPCSIRLVPLHERALREVPGATDKVRALLGKLAKQLPS